MKKSVERNQSDKRNRIHDFQRLFVYWSIFVAHRKSHNENPISNSSQTHNLKESDPKSHSEKSDVQQNPEIPTTIHSQLSYFTLQYHTPLSKENGRRKKDILFKSCKLNLANTFKFTSSEAIPNFLKIATCNKKHVSYLDPEMKMNSRDVCCLHLFPSEILLRPRGLQSRILQMLLLPCFGCLDIQYLKANGPLD
jgi:hypothetical protein